MTNDLYVTLKTMATAETKSATRQTSVDVRVRYVECDPMNVAHHSVYPIWLEIARTELLRAQGSAYRDLEDAGILFVVARMDLRYIKPAYYDDLLQIRVEQSTSGRVKIDHAYQISRDGVVLATASTTLACVDRNHKLRPLPDTFL